MNLRQLITQSALPRNEASVLAAHALGEARTWLIAHDTDALSAAHLDAINAVFERRRGGEPLAYIQAYREFYGLNFAVSPAVLIPRQETELLLDWLIENAPEGAAVLDLGTGSGAIAVALANQRPDLHITACDISPAALAVAAQNNTALANARVRLIESDWFEHITGKFDVIVSNPPYIAAGDAHLSSGDLRFEPLGALTDRADGLSHYRTIMADSLRFLQPAGWLVFEHGYDQSERLLSLLASAGYLNVTQHYDAAESDKRGMPRMITAQVPSVLAS